MNQLFGYDEQYTKLKRLIDADKLPQVLLFHGRAGIGKRLFAANLTALHFCPNPTPAPCGQCPSCQAIAHGNFPDFLHIEGREQNLLLDHATAIQDHLQIKPRQFADAIQSCRIVLVSDIDKMNAAGINRLLKILEEPPAKSRILLTTSNLGLVLKTLLSRCLLWHMAPAPKKQAIAYLASLFGENPAYSEILSQEGLAIGRTIQRLKSTEAGDKPWDLHASYDILQNLSLPELLQRSEDLGKGQKMPASEVARRAEYDLSKLYRQHFLEGKALPRNFSPEKIFARRQLLMQLKKASIRQKIAVNAQLAIEHLGML